MEGRHYIDGAWRDGTIPSGFGARETGSASAEFFTEIKTSYINHGVV